MASGNEFSTRDAFDKLTGKEKKERKPRYMWRALGISFLGALCGGIIFFAVNYFFSIFSVLFFVLSGIGAYTFLDVFLPKEMRNRLQLLVVFLSDILSIILTYIILIFASPSYRDSMGALSDIGISPLAAVLNLFTDPSNLLLLGVSFLFSAAGVGIAVLICMGVNPKKHIKEKKKKKSKGVKWK